MLITVNHFNIVGFNLNIIVQMDFRYFKLALFRSLNRILWQHSISDKIHIPWGWCLFYCWTVDVDRIYVILTNKLGNSNQNIYLGLRCWQGPGLCGSFDNSFNTLVWFHLAEHTIATSFTKALLHGTRLSQKIKNMVKADFHSFSFLRGFQPRHTCTYLMFLASSNNGRK